MRGKDIECIEIECQKCLLVGAWSYRDTIDQSRKVGALIKSGKCPHCGSTRGKIIEESFWPANQFAWMSRRNDW